MDLPVELQRDPRQKNLKEFLEVFLVDLQKNFWRKSAEEFHSKIPRGISKQNLWRSSCGIFGRNFRRNSGGIRSEFHERFPE